MHVSNVIYLNKKCSSINADEWQVTRVKSTTIQLLPSSVVMVTAADYHMSPLREAKVKGLARFVSGPPFSELGESPASHSTQSQRGTIRALLPLKKQNHVPGRQRTLTGFASLELLAHWH